MICVKCGAENPEGAKYCSNCNALLFQAAPTGLPGASTMDLAEDIDYPVPETHYQSPILQQLAWCVHEFLDEDGELDPIIETYEAFREIFEGFRGEIPQLKELQYSSEGVLTDDDPIPSQIRYLISQAEDLYEKGERLFEGYFDALEEMEDEEEEELPDPQPLVDGTKAWLNCNDNICLVFEFLAGRSRAFGEMAEELDQMLAEMPDAEEEVVTSPTDSTDLG